MNMDLFIILGFFYLKIGKFYTFFQLGKGPVMGPKISPGKSLNSFISGLKFSSININSIRGKKLELLAFIDFHQSQILAIQETKIDNSILTSELFPESFPYSVYRKDRTLHGGGVMLLVHKDIPHMPLTELDNDSESVWVKLFVNKKTHFVASWYRPPVDDQYRTMEMTY